MINDKDSHTLSQLIMFNYTALCHALLECRKNKGVDLKASKSKLKEDRPDRSNHFKYTNDDGNNEFCSSATGRKLFTSPGVAEKFTFWMNTWNTLPESYQQRVYKNTFDTVER